VYTAKLFESEDVLVSCVPCSGGAGLTTPEGRNLIVKEVEVLKARLPKFVVNLVGVCFERGEALVSVQLVSKGETARLPVGAR
jgi:hypothetical protein